MAAVVVVDLPRQLSELVGAPVRERATGSTVLEVLVDLDTRYPGLLHRLCDAGRLRPNVVLAIPGAHWSLFQFMVKVRHRDNPCRAVVVMGRKKR